MKKISPYPIRDENEQCFTVFDLFEKFNVRKRAKVHCEKSDVFSEVKYGVVVLLSLLCHQLTEAVIGERDLLLPSDIALQHSHKDNRHQTTLFLSNESLLEKQCFIVGEHHRSLAHSHQINHLDKLTYDHHKQFRFVCLSKQKHSLFFRAQCSFE